MDHELESKQADTISRATETSPDRNDTVKGVQTPVYQTQRNLRSRHVQLMAIGACAAADFLHLSETD